VHDVKKKKVKDDIFAKRDVKDAKFCEDKI